MLNVILASEVRSGLFGFGDSQISGEVFVVTGAHQSVKLGLVAIAAVDPSSFERATSDVRAKMQPELIALDSLVPGAENLASLARELDNKIIHLGSSELGDAYYDTLVASAGLQGKTRAIVDRITSRKEYLRSAAPYFKSLPQPVATTKTDSDGKYSLKIGSGNYVIVAHADRYVITAPENYFWAVKANAPSALTLSNDNMTGMRSESSALKASCIYDRGGETEDVDKIRDDFNAVKRVVVKLAATLKKQLPDLAEQAAEFAEPTPTIVPSELQSVVSWSTPPPVIAVMPAPPAEYVQLTRDVEVPRGAKKITIPRGSKLLVVSRGLGVIGVRYQNQSELVPTSACAAVK